MYLLKNRMESPYELKSTIKTHIPGANVPPLSVGLPWLAKRNRSVTFLYRSRNQGNSPTLDWNSQSLYCERRLV